MPYDSPVLSIMRGRFVLVAERHQTPPRISHADGEGARLAPPQCPHTRYGPRCARFPPFVPDYLAATHVQEGTGDDTHLGRRAEAREGRVDP